MKTAGLVILAFALFVPPPGRAQCSDAGVCSIGHEPERTDHVFSLSYLLGRSASADDLTFHSVGLDAGIAIREGTRLMVGIPFNSQRGPLGSTSGIGDLTLAVNQQVLDEDRITLAVQIGARLATGKDDASGLPQSYQSGLGTNDLLAGATIRFGPWNAAGGYQLSRGRSDNVVTRLKRGDDILIRCGYATEIDAWSVRADILAIKRLQVSSVIDPTSSIANAFRDIPGSDQFQINLQGQVVVPLESGFEAHVMAALPLLERAVNVDGLTRSFTLAAGLNIRF